MKKALLFLATLLFLWQTAFAYDFSAVAPTGQTLYFNVLVGGKAEVTYQQSYPRYSNLSGNLEIPSYVTYGSTTYLVTHIDTWAFHGCSGLTSVIIPNSVTGIGGDSFSSCSGLTSVTIGNSVTGIGSDAFKNCSSLTTVTFNADSCTLYSTPFGGCTSITTFNFGNNVKVIPDYLCYNLFSLTSLTIPDSITTIGEKAFYNCCGLTSLTIPNSVKSIGENAFQYCAFLTTVVFNADSCTYANSPFNDCTSLTNFTFGNNVKSIPARLCSGLSSLTSITSNAFVPPTVVNVSAFNNVSRSIPLYVPTASVSSYQAANVWSEFSNYMGMSTYTITASSADPSMGTVTGSGSYVTGSTVTLTAMPNTGHHFVQWQDGNTQNPRTVTVTDNATYMATFAASTATATATVSQITSSSAHVDIVMGQHTSYYYIIFAPRSQFTQAGLTTDEAIVNYVNQNYGVSDRIYSNVSEYVDELTPTTAFLLVVVPYNSDGIVGTVCQKQFTTLNLPGDATVTATISEVTATSAYAEIVMGQHTLYFYYIYAPQSLFTQNGLITDEALINYFNQEFGPSDRNYNNLSGYMNGLPSNTTFLLVVAPYNSDGIVGTICRKQFTTLNNNGIEGVDEEEYAVNSQDGRLVISGAEGKMVSVYSLNGRCIYSASAKGTTVIDIPASGTYLLKIGNHPARKVVVVR
ncbi:MAG: leucine-rich repeat domain-containing protein [Bacteroidales bacterium]|nr:leucine-rich repeat domain-containing protein [Bacteroidales bacterium]